jgi:hypothetical protein
MIAASNSECSPLQFLAQAETSEGHIMETVTNNKDKFFKIESSCCMRQISLYYYTPRFSGLTRTLVFAIKNCGDKVIRAMACVIEPS